MKTFKAKEGKGQLIKNICLVKIKDVKKGVWVYPPWRAKKETGRAKYLGHQK